MAMRFFAMRVHLAPKVELGDAVFLSILLGVFDGKTNLKDFYRGNTETVNFKNTVPTVQLRPCVTCDNCDPPAPWDLTLENPYVQ